MNREEFCRAHWDYYMLLEEDFLSTRRYITFDLGDNAIYSEQEVSNPQNSRCYSIEYIKQYRADWLNNKSLDFYLPTYNIAIECQGRQHFISDNFFKNIEEIIERDKRKKKLCNDNNIFILYLHFLEHLQH